VETPHHISPEAVAIEMLPIDVVTLFNRYDARSSATLYYNKLKTGFRLVNGQRDGNPHYKIAKSQNHILIYSGNNVIFRVEKNAHSLRNIYLELYDCDFNVGSWFTRRHQGHFDNETYRTGDRQTPPDYEVI
jgi:hypothetical protein